MQGLSYQAAESERFSMSDTSPDMTHRGRTTLAHLTGLRPMRFSGPPCLLPTEGPGISVHRKPLCDPLSPLEGSDACIRRQGSDEGVPRSLRGQCGYKQQAGGLEVRIRTSL